jgi:glycosyltransferase involved in cell wall biosynthesis
MAAAPLVSVLLPVRDAAATLPRCLRSLEAQTLEAHEVIAVDDGSTDASGRVLQEWAARDPRFRIVHTPPQGLVAALRTAAAHARAPLLARMDADDVCAPERLAAQAARLSHAPHLDIVASRVRLRHSSGRAPGGMRRYVAWQNTLLEHEAIAGDLWVESPLVHPSVMMRADVLHRLGGYREFDGPEDYDLWLRAERAGFRLGKHPDRLLDWWDSDGRLTRASSRYAPERFLALKIEALEARHLAAGRAVAIWGAGPIGKSWARALLARGHSVAAFVEVNPRKLGMMIHGAPVITVEAAGSLPSALHLAAVGQRAGREAIRAAAAALGLADGRELIAVA